MVERREYDSFIKSRVEQLLQDVDLPKLQMIDKIREYANSTIREHDFEEQIIQTMKKSSIEFYTTAIINESKLKETINKIYNKIIRLSIEELTEVWLNEQVNDILIELTDLSETEKNTMFEELKKAIVVFTQKYINQLSKAEKDKNNLYIEIEKLIETNNFQNYDELKENLIEYIKSKYPETFTESEIESLIVRYELKNTINLPSTYDLTPIESYYIINDGNKEFLSEKVKKDLESNDIKKTINKFSSTDVIKTIIDEITNLKAANPTQSPRKLQEQLRESTRLKQYSIAVSKQEAPNILKIYEKYQNNLNDLTPDIFIKELFLLKMKNNNRSYYLNLSQTEQDELDSKLQTCINDYYSKIKIETKSYQISESACRYFAYKNKLKSLENKIDVSNIKTTKEYIQDSLVKIFDNIIYVSANNPLEIVRYKEFGIAQINGTFVPIDFLNNLLENIDDIIQVSIKNSHLFLNDYYNVYFDEDYNKYLLPNDDIHVYGLSRGEKGHKKIFAYLLEKLNDENLLDINNLVKLSEERTTIFETDLLIPEEPELSRLINESSIVLGDDYNNSTAEEIKAAKLKQKIKNFDLAQIILNDKLIPKTDLERIELLAYFLKKDGHMTLLSTKQPSKSDIDSVLNRYKYFFGNEYVENLRENEYKSLQASLKKIQNEKNRLTKIDAKYTNLFRIQEVLQYKHQLVALEILKQSGFKPNDVDSNYSDIQGNFGSTIEDLQIQKSDDNYKIISSSSDGTTTEMFTIQKEGNSFIVKKEQTVICKIINGTTVELVDPNKYFITLTEYGTLKIIDKKESNIVYHFDIGKDITSPKMEIRKANIYGLIQTYIQLHANELNKFLNDTSEIKYTGPVNVVKVFDKLLYFNSFNFLLDLENIYLMDLQNFIRTFESDKEKAEMGMICELTALREKIFVLYEKRINEAIRFISIQGTSESNIITSSNSFAFELASFGQKKYKTLIGLSEVNENHVDETYFTSHTKLSQNINSIEDLIVGLKSSKYILRYATASCEETMPLRDSIEQYKEVEIEEMTERTLKGISNVMFWINDLTIEQIRSFVNVKKSKNLFTSLFKRRISQDDQNNLNIIKTILYKQLHDNIKEIIIFLTKYQKTLQDDSKKERIENLINTCKKFTGITHKISDEREEFDEKTSCKLLTELIIQNDTSKFEQTILNENVYRDDEFYQIIKIVSLDLPEYALELLNKIEFSNNTKRVNALKKAVKLSLSYRVDKYEFNTKLLLGPKDEKLSLLQNIEDSIRRSNAYYLAIVGNEDTPITQKLKCEVFSDKKLIKLLEEKKQILKTKFEEIVDYKPTTKEFIEDTLTNNGRKNKIKNEVEKIDAELNEIKENIALYTDTLIFLQLEPSKVKVEHIRALITGSITIVKYGTDLANEIIRKINIVKEQNISDSILVTECDKLLQYLNCTIKINGNIQTLQQIIKDNQKPQNYYRELPQDESTFNAIFISKSSIQDIIEDSKKQNEEHMRKTFYPQLYNTIKEYLGEVPLDEQQDFLNKIIREIKKLCVEQQLEYKSFEDLIIEENIAGLSEIYNSSLEEFGTNIIQCVSSRKDDTVISKEVTQYTAVLLQDMKSLKTATVAEIIRRSDKDRIVPLSEEEKKNLVTMIDEQFNNKEILFKLVQSVMAGIRKSIYMNARVRIIKPSYDEYNSISVKINNYYNYLKGIIHELHMQRILQVLGPSNSPLEYNDFLDMEFKKLVMELRDRTGYEIFDPTDTTFGAASSKK